MTTSTSSLIETGIRAIPTEGLCLLEHTTAPGLIPDRWNHPTLADALAHAAELTANVLTVPELPNGELPQERLTITCLDTRGGAIGEPALVSVGTPEYIHAQVSRWTTAFIPNCQSSVSSLSNSIIAAIVDARRAVNVIQGRIEELDRHADEPPTLRLRESLIRTRQALAAAHEECPVNWKP
ncbi:hypothetical protein [Nocardia fluminea]|uniref:hypothetical protein n=1 Tax=Nocardia fluminea TaxID=134984 RepID=UPI0036548AEF